MKAIEFLIGPQKRILEEILGIFHPAGQSQQGREEPILVTTHEHPEGGRFPPTTGLDEIPIFISTVHQSP